MMYSQRVPRVDAGASTLGFENNALGVRTQIAAVTASLDAIVTRNLADFAHSPIPVPDPAELLKRLSPSAVAEPTTAQP